MRILTILTEFPYPIVGANSLIAYQLLRQWNGRHESTLWCLSEQEVDESRFGEIKRLTRDIRIFPHQAPRSNLDRLRLTFSLRPYGVNLFANRALAAAIRSINPSDYDVIFTQCINSSQYAVLAPSSLGASIPRAILSNAFICAGNNGGYIATSDAPTHCWMRLFW
jgi:hypothetical protein